MSSLSTQDNLNDQFNSSKQSRTNSEKESSHKLNQYETIKMVGYGRFGQVFLIQDKVSKQKFCWKVIPYKGLNKNSKKQLVSEVNLMSKLKHPNIVRYYDRIISRETQSLYIIMEYCNAGDLAHTISMAYRHFDGVKEDIIIEIAKQMLSALAYCHKSDPASGKEQRVLHRDLKPQNIFLTKPDAKYGSNQKFIAKLGDFGLSRQLGILSFAHSCVGTPYYWSPEILRDGLKIYNDKSDMWALGCILYEMATGYTPFSKAQDLRQLVKEVEKGPLLPLPRISTGLNSLILELLRKSPNNRPSAQQCLCFTIFDELSASSTRKIVKNVNSKAGQTPIQANLSPKSYSSTNKDKYNQEHYQKIGSIPEYSRFNAFPESGTIHLNTRAEPSTPIKPEKSNRDTLLSSDWQTSLKTFPNDSVNRNSIPKVNHDYTLDTNPLPKQENIKPSTIYSKNHGFQRNSLSNAQTDTSDNFYSNTNENISSNSQYEQFSSYSACRKDSYCVNIPGTQLKRSPSSSIESSENSNKNSSNQVNCDYFCSTSFNEAPNGTNLSLNTERQKFSLFIAPSSNNTAFTFGKKDMNDHGHIAGKPSNIPEIQSHHTIKENNCKSLPPSPNFSPINNKISQLRSEYSIPMQRHEFDNSALTNSPLLSQPILNSKPQRYSEQSVSNSYKKGNIFIHSNLTKSPSNPNSRYHKVTNTFNPMLSTFNRISDRQNSSRDLVLQNEKAFQSHYSNSPKLDNFTCQTSCKHQNFCSACQIKADNSPPLGAPPWKSHKNDPKSNYSQTTIGNQSKMCEPITHRLYSDYPSAKTPPIKPRKPLDEAVIAPKPARICTPPMKSRLQLLNELSFLKNIDKEKKKDSIISPLLKNTNIPNLPIINARKLQSIERTPLESDMAYNFYKTSYNPNKSVQNLHSNTFPHSPNNSISEKNHSFNTFKTSNKELEKAARLKNTYIKYNDQKVPNKIIGNCPENCSCSYKQTSFSPSINSHTGNQISEGSSSFKNARGFSPRPSRRSQPNLNYVSNHTFESSQLNKQKNQFETTSQYQIDTSPKLSFQYTPKYLCTQYKFNPPTSYKNSNSFKSQSSSLSQMRATSGSLLPTDYQIPSNAINYQMKDEHNFSEHYYPYRINLIPSYPNHYDYSQRRTSKSFTPIAL